jgi:hypothetical protein
MLPGAFFSRRSAKPNPARLYPDQGRLASGVGAPCCCARPPGSALKACSSTPARGSRGSDAPIRRVESEVLAFIRPVVCFERREVRPHRPQAITFVPANGLEVEGGADVEIVLVIDVEAAVTASAGPWIVVTLRMAVIWPSPGSSPDTRPKDACPPCTIHGSSRLSAEPPDVRARRGRVDDRGVPLEQRAILRLMGVAVDLDRHAGFENFGKN